MNFLCKIDFIFGLKRIALIIFEQVKSSMHYLDLLRFVTHTRNKSAVTHSILFKQKVNISRALNCVALCARRPSFVCNVASQAVVFLAQPVLAYRVLTDVLYGL